MFETLEYESKTYHISSSWATKYLVATNLLYIQQINFNFGKRDWFSLENARSYLTHTIFGLKNM